MKICNKCKKERKVSEFNLDKTKFDGLTTICKICKEEYRHSHEGVARRIYSNQKTNSKKRQMKLPNYTIDEFLKWLLVDNKQLFDKLMKNWKNSNYDRNLRPSVDRKNDFISYTFDNIQLMTFGENCDKANKDIKNGKLNKQCKAVIQYTMDGIFIKEYLSLAIASRETNTERRNIQSVINGTRKSANGFKWS